MAQQNEGWPLGLQPLNARIGLARNRNNSGSMSFNALFSGSPSSFTDSSSNLDTESTGSFFHDKSITLGSLIGVSSILELSRRSLRRAKTEIFKSNNKRNKSNSRSWLFCLRLRSSSNPDGAGNQKSNNPPSLGQFLAEERKAANENRRSQISPPIYGPDDEFVLAQTIAQPNSLFVNGTIAPPPTAGSLSQELSIATDRESRASGHGNNWFGSHLFSCMWGKRHTGS